MTDIVGRAGCAPCGIELMSTARNPENNIGTFAPYKNTESGIVGRAGPQDCAPLGGVYAKR